MTEQRLRVRGHGPIWMRSIRDGLLHAQVVESEFVIDRARDEHVVFSDAAGCLADVPEGQAEMDVDLVFRRVLIPRRRYPQVDQSLNIRELARRIAEVEFGEAPNFLSLEYWHLTACAAELVARTPSERLPWSYAKRFSAAFDVIRDAPDSKSSFRMALEGWAEEFFADDTNAEPLLRVGELPLQRLMEALGPTAAREALREGAARSRRSRDAVVRAYFNINGQWDAVRANVSALIGDLERRGVSWNHVSLRDLPPPMDRTTWRPTGESLYAVAEWLSPDVYVTALHDQQADHVCVLVNSPQHLQLDLVGAVLSRTGTQGLISDPSQPIPSPSEIETIISDMVTLIRADRFEHALLRGEIAAELPAAEEEAKPASSQSGAIRSARRVSR